jgi:hypothetical protein
MSALGQQTFCDVRAMPLYAPKADIRQPEKGQKRARVDEVIEKTGVQL